MDSRSDSILILAVNMSYNSDNFILSSNGSMVSVIMLHCSKNWLCLNGVCYTHHWTFFVLVLATAR